MNIKLIEKINPILNVFNNIYVVGGSVRDMVMGIEPSNADLTINLPINKIEHKLKVEGIASTVIKKDLVVVKLKDKLIEISSFKGSTINEDLAHRDFSINSMAFKDGKIIDPYDGLKDIKDGIIRSVNPAERFGEDPFRMLRALRFVSTLGFRIEKNTKNGIDLYAHSILTTAKDRWFPELTKLLLGNNVKPALELLFKTGLLGYIIPELYPVTMVPRNQNLPTKDLWYHTKVVVNKSKSIPAVRWAALLHDIAKPQTMKESSGNTHFFQHEYLGAEIADNVLRRLKAGSGFRRAVVGLIALHQRIGDTVSRRNDPPVSVNALRRLIRDCDERKCKIEDLVELFAADCSSGRKEVVERQNAHADLLRKALKEIKAEDLRPKLPKGIGQMLMKHFSLPPSPEVGVLKERLNSMLVSGEISADMDPHEMFRKLKWKKS